MAIDFNRRKKFLCHKKYFIHYQIEVYTNWTIMAIAQYFQPKILLPSKIVFYRLSFSVAGQIEIWSMRCITRKVLNMRSAMHTSIWNL